MALKADAFLCTTHLLTHSLFLYTISNQAGETCLQLEENNQLLYERFYFLSQICWYISLCSCGLFIQMPAVGMYVLNVISQDVQQSLRLSYKY